MNPGYQPAERSSRDAIPAEAVSRMRKQYEGLISDLLGERLPEQAYQLADLAVAQGLWLERLHRPIELHPTSCRSAFFDPTTFWFMSHLQEFWEPIRAEIEQIADPTEAGFSTAGVAGSTVRGGRWHQLMLWDRGRRFDRACDLLPVTADVLSAIPDVTDYGNGFVMVSWLQPGTWIPPHCGPTNSKARTHFCIRTDESARIRVRDEVLGWQDGECFTFDDSFEHEVWHHGQVPRVVLIVDAPNPHLVDVAGVVRHDQANWSDEMYTFMASRQVQRLARTGEDVTVTFSDSMLEFMRSYMDTRQIETVELRRDALVVNSADPRLPGAAGPLRG